MAEGKKEKKSSSSSSSSSNEESVKLFVGQVPKHMTEAQLMAMFKEFALVDEVNIIKDKITRASRGCCFLICPSRQEADKAVNACHNKKTLSGVSSFSNLIPPCIACYLVFSCFLSHCVLLKINSYAMWDFPGLEHKLFVGMLPKNVSEVEVSDLFSKYGTIKDLQILRGCAFLKYETKEQALAALEDINGKHKMEGSSVPLVVKWADTEKERQARRAQKSQAMPNTDSQHPSLFGALPMGYAHPYNGYGYQAPGVYGLMPYRLPPMQNQAAFHSLVPPVNQGNALRGGIRPDLSPNISPRNYAPTTYVGSAYPTVTGLQYPVAYPGAMMTHRPLSSSPGALSPTVASSNSATPSGVSGSSGVQVEGPPGANLFIYHIPQEFSDQELANAFQAFGKVLSAKVFVDKATGVSKCFGFVSYDSPAAAQNAINMMNGCQLGGESRKQAEFSVICGHMQPGYMGVTRIRILGWIDNLWSFAFPHPCNCFMGLKFPKFVIHDALCADTICQVAIDLEFFSSFQNIEDIGDSCHRIRVCLILKLCLHLKDYRTKICHEEKNEGKHYCSNIVLDRKVILLLAFEFSIISCFFHL
ncbi:hypothetical protein SADUNF_Sadunf14G0101800 [Salix dunnii]|uniref:RRM domain-containing protein n=1 Tax=Salix dunnii TaxID=1413687 RepID=A0A835MKS2_9ROSI|nr:hypothetical protein SADUNF_Sadunf14G0101800 [Salix dunnii]